jgi:hypothetical protein
VRVSITLKQQKYLKKIGALPDHADMDGILLTPSEKHNIFARIKVWLLEHVKLWLNS